MITFNLISQKYKRNEIYPVLNWSDLGSNYTLASVNLVN
jgi:hypothetical protein